MLNNICKHWGLETGKKSWLESGCRTQEEKGQGYQNFFRWAAYVLASAGGGPDLKELFKINKYCYIF
jgi:hypothetical protein